MGLQTGGRRVWGLLCLATVSLHLKLGPTGGLLNPQVPVSWCENTGQFLYLTWSHYHVTKGY